VAMSAACWVEMTIVSTRRGIRWPEGSWRYSIVTWVSRKRGRAWLAGAKGRMGVDVGRLYWSQDGASPLSRRDGGEPFLCSTCGPRGLSLEVTRASHP
jgi:hypothetical protein